jgi:hypothetical protein
MRGQDGVTASPMAWRRTCAAHDFLSGLLDAGFSAQSNRGGALVDLARELPSGTRVLHLIGGGRGGRLKQS